MYHLPLYVRLHLAYFNMSDATKVQIMGSQRKSLPWIFFEVLITSSVYDRGHYTFYEPHTLRAERSAE